MTVYFYSQEKINVKFEDKCQVSFIEFGDKSQVLRDIHEDRGKKNISAKG